MRTSSVTAGAVALGIALLAVVTSVGSGSAEAAPTCRGDRITVADLASGCAVSTGTVVLPDGRRFTVPAAGVTVSALPLGAPGTSDAGDASVTNTGRAGVAVRVDDVWKGSAAAVRQERDALRSRLAATPQAATTTTSTKPSSCTNKTYAKLGFTWKAPVSWAYNPAGQRVSGASTIHAGADAWTGGIAACSKKVTTTAGERLVGNTTQAIAVTATGGCGASSGTSVVGWGALPKNTLAVTCVWSRSGSAIEVDQRYTTAQQWSTASTCSGPRFDLRGVATHEWGHAFGLGHTAQSSGLVMRPASTICDTGQRTLGLGDVLGIDALY